jgi:hypothetical protein
MILVTVGSDGIACEIFVDLTILCLYIWILWSLFDSESLFHPCFNLWLSGLHDFVGYDIDTINPSCRYTLGHSRIWLRGARWPLDAMGVGYFPFLFWSSPSRAAPSRSSATIHGYAGRWHPPLSYFLHFNFIMFFPFPVLRFFVHFPCADLDPPMYFACTSLLRFLVNLFWGRQALFHGWYQPQIDGDHPNNLK